MNSYRTSVRQALRVVALGVLPLLVAAACSGSGGGSGGSGGSDRSSAQGCQPSGGKVTLTFWSWEPGIDKIVDVWNAQNPDIQVKVKEVVSGPMGTYQNYNNAIKAHTTPDIGMIEYDSLGSYRLQNALTNLASCAGIARAESAFVPWTWSQGTFGESGAVYAVPQDTGPMAMYYRKDIFTRYHIPVPSTWDEYYQDAKLLVAADPKAKIMHIGQDAAWFQGLLWQNGARPFHTDGNAVTVRLASPAERKVADYWQRMIDQKLVTTNIASFSPALYKAWDTGQIVTEIGAAWGYSLIRDNAKSTAGKWAVAPLPQWDPSQPAAGNWGGSSNAVFAGSKHPLEAAKFITWLGSDPQAVRMLNQLGGSYPASVQGLQLPALSQGVPFYGGQHIFDVFAKAAGQVDPSFQWGPDMTDTDTFINDGFAAAVGGHGTLHGAMVDAQTKTVDALKAKGITATTG